MIDVWLTQRLETWPIHPKNSEVRFMAIVLLFSKLNVLVRAGYLVLLSDPILQQLGRFVPDCIQVTLC